MLVPGTSCLSVLQNLLKVQTDRLGSPSVGSANTYKCLVQRLLLGSILRVVFDWELLFSTCRDSVRSSPLPFSIMHSKMLLLTTSRFLARFLIL